MSFVEHGDTGTLRFATDAWQAGTATGNGRGLGQLEARRATSQECA
jgi:hypothetical protein